MNFSRGSGPTILMTIATVLLGFSFVTTLSAAQESKSAAAPTGNVENGKRLFMKDGCYQCHGREGQGSVMSGPRLAPNPVPLEALLRYVRKPSGEMPPYTEKVISDQELTDIYAFLQSRANPQPAKANALLK
jgi:ubiquinol-cytochrome c reductase cytochrome c subunit